MDPYIYTFCNKTNSWYLCSATKSTDEEKPGEQHQKPDHQPAVHSATEESAKTKSIPEGTSLLCNCKCNTTTSTPTVAASAARRLSRRGTCGDLQIMSSKRRLSSRGSIDCPLSTLSRPPNPWGRFDPYDAEDLEKDFVGFAMLPNQVQKRTVKKGFTFTLMVAGESGLGKSTLINSLFLTNLYEDWKVPTAQERIDQTVDIVKHSINIEEKGIRVRLSIIDTPGFGDAVNNADSWYPIEDYIDKQFEQYFKDESGLNRRDIQDNRVHCLLYFISPFGHGLRALDVACMKALHNKVNIIPVVAKADSLTQSEVRRKKSKIREEIEHFGINIYQLPDCDSDEDEDFKKQDQILKESTPLAVVGSNVEVESEGSNVRGRAYPWGVVEVENPAHCDFLLLRNMLVRTHMHDLKEVTGDILYENYRAHCIESMTRMVVHEKKRRSGGTSVQFMNQMPLFPDLDLSPTQLN